MLMKDRQPRIATLISARLNSNDGWSDVIIRNISAQGAMLQLATPPRRGTYVELRRGASVIIGRTIWSDGNNCGIKAQDRIAIESWTSTPGAAATDTLCQDERRRIRRAPPAVVRIDARSVGLLLQSFAVTLFIALFVIIGVDLLFDRVVPLVSAIRGAL